MQNPSAKRVLITGSGIRIGAELVRTYARAGYQVVIHARSSVHEAEALLREIGGASAGHGMVISPLDSDQDVDVLWQQVRAFGRIDELIHNAGVFARYPFAEEPESILMTHTRLHYLSPFRLCQHFAAQSDLEHSGHIIFMLDQTVDKLHVAGASYTLSKKMARDLALYLAVELAPRIRVNAVCPGPTLPPRSLPNSKMEHVVAKTALKRPVPLQDLTAAALFLSRTESVTGQLLFIDSGAHLMSE